MGLLIFVGIVVEIILLIVLVLALKSDSKSPQETVPPDVTPLPQSNIEPAKLNIEMTEVGQLRLSHEQQAIFDIVEKGHDCVYITGKAGTGKSLLLQYLVHHSKKSIVVVAPTGIAALNVGGMTIHSFFKFPPSTVDLSEVTVDYKTREILRHTDTLIIDEISMVLPDIMEGINAKLQIARRNHEPFGGVQVVMFGDLYQLPPVVPDGQLRRFYNHTYGGIYFFNAPIFEKVNLKIYELDKIFRQNDPEFRRALNFVRNGVNLEDALTTLNQRAYVEIPQTGVLTLAGNNATVSHINHDKLSTLDGIEHTYVATIVGDLKESAFPTEKYLKLKPGAQIMLLKNDIAKPGRWVNGTLGVITKLSDEVIRVDIDGVEHSINRSTWDKVTYDYDSQERLLKKVVVSTFTQFPVRLAWAITIHKSQGQTYQSVAVDLSAGAFVSGQTYVALSRCVSLEGLYLESPIRPADVIVDEEIIEFMKSARIVKIVNQDQALSTTLIEK